MKKLLFIFAILVSSIAKAQDPEVWGTLKLEGKINDKWKVEMEGEDRYNFRDDDLRYFHFDIGFVYSLSKRFGVGGYYRDIFVHKGENHIKSTVPHVDFFYSSPSGFKLRMRNEYIMVPGKLSAYRFRLRPGYQTKWFKNFNPFFQDEIFLSEISDLSRNRFNTGVAIKLGNLTIEPGYMLESEHRTNWSHRNILWINTKLKF